MSDPSDTSMDESETLADETNAIPDDVSLGPDAAFLENRDTPGVPDGDDKNEDFCIIGMGKYEERLLLQQLENQPAGAVANNMTAKRLRRKLILRQLKQERNIPLFDLDEYMNSSSEMKNQNWCQHRLPIQKSNVNTECWIGIGLARRIAWGENQPTCHS